ncbi:MAG TPA: family 20 glycosylhydrolase, partial [Spirochaetia bacterium]|nr:family 20 glycosylhydrolase [Spirochaetia bacterium]
MHSRFIRSTSIALIVTVHCTGVGAPGNAYSIIPKPAHIEVRTGAFVIDEHTSVVMDESSAPLEPVAQFLGATLRACTGYPVPVVRSTEPAKAADAIVLALAAPSGGTEGESYRMVVAESGVHITSGGPPGAFYAVQTLLQLLPPECEYGTPVYGISWRVPCVAIQDKPRFPWRGMHLDVGRHFFPKQFVERYIDLIARYKMNTFHWHLTEDQGWRIEIKKYPKLTEVGAWRKETLGDGRPYGGFYSQDDIREVVAYAQERFVTIVPEIEMPGHCTAALAAYPELSCTGGPFSVATGWHVFKDVYCAGNDRTFEFLQDVLTEVIALFPGPFIHIGGDEVPKDRWMACPRCQKRIKDEGLANEHELQSYFIKRIEKFVNEKGKRLVGWDEILEGGLAPNATVMSWRGVQGGIDAATSGHDVVMTPTSDCYFDYAQGLSGEPESFFGYLPLERVYSYEPVPAGLSTDASRHVLGAQGNVWTEYIATDRHAEYMAFPRACALAEVVWSPPEGRDYQEFLTRLATHFDRFRAHGVNARINTPTGFEGSHILFYDTTVTVAGTVPGAVVRFTTDGSDPTPESRIASAPVRILSSQEVKARTFLADGAMSTVASGYYSLLDSSQNGVAYQIVRGATRET